MRNCTGDVEVWKLLGYLTLFYRHSCLMTAFHSPSDCSPRAPPEEDANDVCFTVCNAPGRHAPGLLPGPAGACQRLQSARVQRSLEHCEQSVKAHVYSVVHQLVLI